MRRKYFFYTMTFLGLIIASGCEKFLDKKPKQSLALLQTTGDLQALLDRYLYVNFSDPSASVRSADDHYLPDDVWSSLDEDDRNVYIWNKDNQFPDDASNDWAYTYNNVYRANAVLNQLKNIDRTELNHKKWDDLKGQALLLRGKSFLLGAFIWAPAYDPVTAETDLGIPLRLDPNFNKKSVRSTVRQTYDQIIKDLRAAIPLLPITPVHPVRASRPAALAWLSRAFLSMRQYDSAYHYADACLDLKNDLMDYNTDESIMPTASYRIAMFNKEVIMASSMTGHSRSSSPSRARIDTLLYGSYDSNDLRKTIFFRQNSDGTFRFCGSYLESMSFNGVATDEMYLTRAECLARRGETQKAMDDLNTVLVKRWKTGTFVPFSAASSQEALNIILQERRKELPFRGLRWIDIKRLNKEGANIGLIRKLNGQTYSLPPNDPRFALALPESVIKLTGMPQNPR